MKRSYQRSAVVLLMALLSVWPIQLDASNQTQDGFTFAEATIPNIGRMAWRPDGQMFAAISGNSILLYSRSLRFMRRLDSHTDRVNSLTWSPDGSKLASGSSDHTVRIWDLLPSSPSYGTVVTTLTTGNEVYVVSWSPDTAQNQLAVSSLDHVNFTTENAYAFIKTEIWSVDFASVIYTLPDLINSAPNLEWTADGQELLASTLDLSGDYTVVRWNQELGDAWDYLPPPSLTRIDSLAFGPNRNTLAIGTDTGEVIVVDIGSAQRLQYFDVSDVPVFSANWSQDESWIAAAGDDSSIYIFNTISAQTPYVLLGHEDDVFQVEWSPVAGQLLTASRDDNLKLWDLSSLPPNGAVPTLTSFPTFAPMSTDTLTPVSSPTATFTPVNKLLFSMETSANSLRPQLFATGNWSVSGS